jgi:flagellar hook-length control protein FliK
MLNVLSDNKILNRSGSYMPNIQGFSNQLVKPSNAEMGGLSKDSMNESSPNNLLYMDFIQTLTLSFEELKAQSLDGNTTNNPNGAISPQGGNSMPFLNAQQNETTPLSDEDMSLDELIANANSIDATMNDAKAIEEAADVAIPIDAKASDVKASDVTMQDIDKLAFDSSKVLTDFAPKPGLTARGFNNNEFNQPSATSIPVLPASQPKAESNFATSNSFLTEITAEEKALSSLKVPTLMQEQSNVKNRPIGSAADHAKVSNLPTQSGDANTLLRGENSFTQPFKAEQAIAALSPGLMLNYSEMKKSSDLKDFKLDVESKLTEGGSKNRISSLLDFNELPGQKGRMGFWDSSSKSGLMQLAEQGLSNLNKPMSQPLQASSNAQVGINSAENQVNQNTLPQIHRTDLKLATTHPQWDKAFNQRIVMMQKQQHQLAEIRLNPIHMGPIKVSIQKGESDSSIQMWAANAQTRELIEQALPKLKEMLLENDSGDFELEMNDFSNHSQQSEQSKQAEDSLANQHSQNIEEAEEIDESDVKLVELTLANDNRVDFFA